MLPNIQPFSQLSTSLVSTSVKLTYDNVYGLRSAGLLPVWHVERISEDMQVLSEDVSHLKANGSSPPPMRTLLREFLAQVGQKRYTSLILFWIPNRQQHSHHKSLTSNQSMHRDEFLFYGQQYEESLWSRFIFCKVSVSSAPHLDKSLQTGAWRVPNRQGGP